MYPLLNRIAWRYPGAKEQPIVLYCGTGGRSALAALTAEALGYKNVRSMNGGIVAWAEARHPIDFPG